MRRRPPLTIGSEHNDWTVVEQIDLEHAICKCKCGDEHRVIIDHLLAGRSKRCRTCGNEKPSHKWRPTNGTKYPPKLKRAVTDAINRCADEKDKNYGGREIMVYLPWVDDPRLFIEHLMTLDGWENPELVLDRVNNNGNYEPGNLRWATYTLSGQNKRQVLPSIMTSERIVEAIELRKHNPKQWTYRALGERYGASPAAVFLAVKKNGDL